MSEIITLLTIGFALSLDAFSLALSFGTLNIENKKSILIAIVVGIFHFFMPLLGLLVGSNIIKIFSLSGDFFVAIILLYISFEMIRSLITKEEFNFDLKITTIITFAFLVSMDSFSIGLGINVITSHIILASLIFSIISAIFTYLGLIVGKYTKQHFGTIANLIGAILLFILGITHLL